MANVYNEVVNGKSSAAALARKSKADNEMPPAVTRRIARINRL